jgi:hypothetical protein
VTPAEAKAARIQLATMDPNTIVEFIGPGGKPVEMTAANALKYFGRQESANKKFEEAAKSRAEMDDIVKRMSEAVGDPRRFREELRALNLNPKQYAEMILAAEQEDEALTPEQRRIRELEAAQAEREEQDKSEKQKQFEAQRDHIRGQYEKRFADISDEMGVPDKPRVRHNITRDLFEYARYVRGGDAKRGVEPHDMTKSEAKAVIKAYMEEHGISPRQAVAPPEPLRAAPPLPPRADDGKFVKQPPPGHVPRTTPDGRRVVLDASKIFDR